ncbi:MAG: ATP-binding protein [Mycoplasmataceae bacterium]|nr:ATP-binding protein [Mycoplasmataceae bacterium]
MSTRETIRRSSIKNINRIKGEENAVVGFASRNIYKIISENSNIVALGLRRIGKTELLKQFVKEYLDILRVGNKLPTFDSMDVADFYTTKEKISDFSSKSIDIDFRNTRTKEKEILFLKLDSTEFTVLSTDEKRRLPLTIKEYIVDNNIKLVLLDEIQVLDNWTYLIKDIVDELGSDVRVIVTGSNSKDLLESTEMGVGRFEPRIFGVLSYSEMKAINTNRDLSVYMDYSHFPHYDIEKYDDEVSLAVIEKAFSSTKSQKQTLYKVLASLVNMTGSETSKTNVSKIANVNKTHIESYISALKSTQLIFEVTNINIKGTNSKYYPLIPGMNRLFTGISFEESNDSKKGFLFEQFVIIQILSNLSRLSERMDIHYYRDNKTGNEIDFIINKIAVEVKHSKSIKNIHKYISIVKKQKFSKMVFVYLGETKKEIIDGVQVKYINWQELGDYEF